MTTPTSMTKSPRRLVRSALARAQEALPAYSCPTSRKDFTQHQLFAILALKTFLNTDYRGVVAFLDDFAELRADLGLTVKVPHPSTLCYADQRLLKKGASSLSRSRSSSMPTMADGSRTGQPPRWTRLG
jgi:hypothetical protein